MMYCTLYAQCHDSLTHFHPIDTRLRRHIINPTAVLTVRERPTAFRACVRACELTKLHNQDTLKLNLFCLFFLRKEKKNQILFSLSLREVKFTFYDARIILLASVGNSTIESNILYSS